MNKPAFPQMHVLCNHCRAESTALVMAQTQQWCCNIWSWLLSVLQDKSDSVMALAEDHRNDILSNATAIACGIGASFSRKVWWIDPAGAILISLYIIWSWAVICKGQVCCIICIWQLHHGVAAGRKLFAWILIWVCIASSSILVQRGL